jgi:hypothetical protein
MTLASDDELRSMVQLLLDRQELSDLLAKYGRFIDDRDLENLAELFTSDAEFDSRVGPVRGRDAVLGYYRDQLSTYTVTYHYPHSQTVEFTGPDDATGVVQAHAELAIDGTGVIIGLRYNDTYRREDGRWRFRSRKAQQLYGLPISQWEEGLGAEYRKRWPGAEPAAADIPESLPTYREFFGLDD